MTLLTYQERPDVFGSVGVVVPDYTTLITNLGGNSVVPFFYDSRFGVTLSGSSVATWDDVRGSGAGFGLTLAPATPSTQKPSYDSVNKIINFDHTQSQNLQTSSLANVTLSGGFALVLVVGSATAVTNGTLGQVTVGNQTQFIRMRTDSTATSVAISAQDSAGAVSTTAISSVFGVATTVRVIFAATAGNAGVCECEIPTATARTATNTGTWNVPGHLDLGRTQSGLGFVDMSLLAVIGLQTTGLYTTAQRDAIDSWATSVRGATLK